MQSIKSNFFTSKELYRVRPSFFKAAFKHALIFLVFVVLANAKINQSINPFTYGMLFALIFGGVNPFILSLSYVGAVAIFNSSLTVLIAAAYTGLIALISFYLNKNFEHKLKLPLFVFYVLLSQAIFIYFNCADTTLLIEASTSVLLGVLFMLAGIKIVQAIMNPRLKYRLTIDEIISGSVIIMAISLGLYNLSPFNIELLRVFAVFAIIFCTYIFSGTAALFMGGIIGLGVAFYSADLTYISIFVVWAMVSGAFKSSKPILSCLAVLMLDVIFGLYFNAYLSYSLYSVASNVIGCFLFLLCQENLLTISSSRTPYLQYSVYQSHLSS